MPIAYLTRIVEFTATHRIARADWSPARNAAVFGTAAEDHAHRYQCRVTVKGPFVAEEAGVVNLTELDALLQREITARLDGAHINRDVPEFADGRRLVTGEALAVYVWERLARALPAGVTLHAIRVQEGSHLYSEYFGAA
jgi:6-pyruvoyltetrahydropterin/6-carboxytetrahydropterin synthase